MQGQHAPEQVLKWMTEVSGLPVSFIVRLYAMGPMPAVCETPSLEDDLRVAAVAPDVDRSAEG